MAGSTLDLIALWVSTVAQTVFVLLWLTQRWWMTQVGRAIMAKSAMLAILFLMSLAAYYVGPLPMWLRRAAFYSITAAIVWQAVTIAREIRQARREHRAVEGTNGSRHER